jgi:hypothetical protein
MFALPPKLITPEEYTVPTLLIKRQLIIVGVPLLKLNIPAFA